MDGAHHPRLIAHDPIPVAQVKGGYAPRLGFFHPFHVLGKKACSSSDRQDLICFPALPLTMYPDDYDF